MEEAAASGRVCVNSFDDLSGTLGSKGTGSMGVKSAKEAVVGGSTMVVGRFAGMRSRKRR